MANTVDVNTLHDGQRNAILHIRIEGDGTGEESASSLLDVSTLLGAPDRVKINSIGWALTGFSASLLWDATADELAWECSEGEGYQEFEVGGGLINKAGAGVTGDFNITTVGLGSGDNGSIILWLRKKFT